MKGDTETGITREVQGELALAAKVRRDAGQMEQDVAEFERLLADLGPLTARQICGHRAGWDDRYVRKLAEHSARVLSFPGSPGYSLIAAASDETLRHAANAIATQVEVMQAKRVRFENILGLRHAAQKLGDVPLSDERTSGALAAYLAGEGH